MRWIRLTKTINAQSNQLVFRLRSSSTFTKNVGDEPFYGRAREPYKSNRLDLTLQHAFTALRDPTRADAVAAVGELTGTVALRNLHNRMEQDPVGRRILQDRPLVSKATIPFAALIEQSKQPTTQEESTFGQAYGTYLREHEFDPDARDPVRYFDPASDEAYIITRYRQCHDFWHALTGLPPTVPGELGLKWLELFQTGLPVAAMSCTAAVWTLPWNEQKLVWEVYLPWARRVHERIESQGTHLLNVYYEEEWDTPLLQLRARLGIEPAPSENTRSM